MLRKKIIFLLLALIITTGCSSIRTNTEFYNPILENLKKGNFGEAQKSLTASETAGEYSEKERVLLHLDKGIVYHYNGEFDKSNAEFELAEEAMEYLYTKSISRGAASAVLNDNVLEYDGEAYEDLYVNLFKALNYLNLNNFDDAYVEIKRVNDKLAKLDTRYEEKIAMLNKSDEAKIEIEQSKIGYLSNVLAHYISHLIFRAEGEEDNSRISLDKLHETWERYPEVYNFPTPSAIDSTTISRGSMLNILAFAGTAPVKKPVGARITTFDNFVVVSNPENFQIQPVPFPGVNEGWNFKFVFPSIVEEGTNVYDIEVYVDSVYKGNLELLENMANVARKTFESEKTIIYFKSIMRAVAKGVTSGMISKKLDKETGGGILGGLASALTNAAFDLTENADLRCWRTLPGYCFTAEFPLDEGVHKIEILFKGQDGKTLSKRTFNNFIIKQGINLAEAFYLN